MKPLEAADRLAIVAALLEAGQGLPPGELRLWFVGALRRRLQDPRARLDRLLELTSRKGGRGGYIGSPLRERNQRLRQIAADLPGGLQAKAEQLHDLAHAGRLDLAASQLPSVRQLMRILRTDS